MGRIIRLDDAVVVEMHDRPCDSGEDYERVKRLLVHAGRQHARLVVDCGEVEWVAGPFLSALLAALKALGARPGDIVLCGLRPVPRQVFEVTHLDRIFPLYADRQAALRAGWPEPSPLAADENRKGSAPALENR